MELKIFINDRSAIKEGIQKEIDTKLKPSDRYEDETEEEYRERKKIESLIGSDEDDIDGSSLMITIDPDKIEDDTAVIVPCEVSLVSITGIYKDNVNLIQGQEKMIVLSNNDSFDAVYEEDKYETIKEYIRLQDKVNMMSLSIHHDQLLQTFMQQQAQQAMKQVGKQKSSKKDEKVIPMANFDNNKN